MGSIMSAISDDMDSYEAVCKQYGENPHYTPDAYGNMLLDCYGKHAKELEARNRKEWDEKLRTPTAPQQKPSAAPTFTRSS